MTMRNLPGVLTTYNYSLLIFKMTTKNMEFFVSNKNNAEIKTWKA
jgi:hypothetical protein